MPDLPNTRDEDVYWKLRLIFESVKIVLTGVIALSGLAIAWGVQQGVQYTYTDPDYGCQYIVTGSSVTPRLDIRGDHVGCYYMPPADPPSLDLGPYGMQITGGGCPQ
jgi:hypothetical protein